MLLNAARMTTKWRKVSRHKLLWFASQTSALGSAMNPSSKQKKIMWKSGIATLTYKEEQYFNWRILEKKSSFIFCFLLFDFEFRINAIDVGTTAALFNFSSDSDHIFEGQQKFCGVYFYKFLSIIIESVIYFFPDSSLSYVLKN